MAQIAPQIRYSTHDNTVPTPTDLFSQGWADVKTPGDGFIYSVGSMEVNSSQSGDLFSGVDVQPLVPHVPFVCTVQAFFFVNQPIPAGNPATVPPLPCGIGSTNFAASPALFIAY